TAELATKNFQNPCCEPQRGFLFSSRYHRTSASLHLPPPPAAVLEFNTQNSPFNIPPPQAAAGSRRLPPQK
ncbi:MAG: hypothetical protein P8P36_06880, partial [Akkermansiaceae bacterium]|nr:hypothetical protein [Akkermansiaceae bacterium]